MELEVARKQTWNGAIAAHVDSDQAEELFPFLSASPVMREWIGGRQAKGLDAKFIRIENKHYEATLEFLTSELRRDKTGQINARISELALRAATHPQALLSTLINEGESRLCYDGQYFFDTDHSEGSSGTQSNRISVDITTLGVPLAQQGTATAPSAWTLAEAVSRAVLQMFTFRDDVGEPMNGEAEKFLVMVPNGFFPATLGLGAAEFAFGVPSPLAAMKWKVQTVVNPRLAFTDKFCVFRTDGRVRPFIVQTETEVSVKMLGEGSDREFDTGRQLVGIDQWLNVEYGYWSHAVLAQLV